MKSSVVIFQALETSAASLTSSASASSLASTTSTAISHQRTSLWSTASDRRVSNISEKLDFHDPFHKTTKRYQYSHFGAKNDQAIRIRKFFEELGL